MRRYATIAALCLMTAFLCISPAHAQVSCATYGINPNTPVGTLPALNGTFGFKVQGFQIVAGNVIPIAAVGVFTTSVGPANRTPGVIQGTVTTTETVNVGGTVEPINSNVSGIFQVDGNCAGGTLSLGPGFPAGFREFRFVFVSGLTQLYLVNADNNGVVTSGEAKRII